MGALAQFHEGKNDFETGAYGKQIGRYKFAVQILKESLSSKTTKHASVILKGDLSQFLSNVESLLPALIKDNDIVCMNI